MSRALRAAGRFCIIAAAAPVLFVLFWAIGLLFSLVYGVILSLVFVFVCLQFLMGEDPDESFRALEMFLPLAGRRSDCPPEDGTRDER